MKGLSAVTKIGIARCLLMLFAVLSISVPIRAEVVISSLDTPQNKVREFKAKIDPVIQGYFQAVASGDEEKALSWYDWTYISTHSMHAARQAAQDAMRLLAQQIKDNGGLRKVEVVGIFGGIGIARVILQMEFANGFKDISGGIKMKSEGYGQEADWKLAIEAPSLYSSNHPSLAVAGVHSAMKTLEAYYAAVQAGDEEALERLSYNDYWLEKQPANRKPGKKGTVTTWGDVFAGTGAVADDYGTPEQRLRKRLALHIEQMQTLIKANGGITGIEVSDLSVSEGQVGTQHKKPVAKDDNQYKRLSTIELRVDVRYGNNKTDSNKNMVFILDDGEWKLELLPRIY